MKWLKKILIVVGWLLGAFIIFAIVYKAIYSMDKAEAFEVNSPELETRLLIATQGSSFKDALVAHLVDSIRQEPVYIEVRDIEVLESVRFSDWQAILVIHTWEYSKPPELIREFADRAGQQKNILFFTTSGDGGFSMNNIDAISGASSQKKMDTYVNSILSRLRPMLMDRTY